jgi:copper(I)-binding protein
MNPIRSLTAAAVALFLSSAAWAQVTVTDPWIRGTTPSQMATGAFMKITSPKPAKLVDASSPVAGVVEIHEMAMEGNVMKMRAVPSLDLPAGRTVELKPGGYHVMLMDLKRQLKEGETVPVTLVFEAEGQRTRLELPFAVRAPTARNDMLKKHGH